ncbi:oligosaccharide flippase family protein [Patulibacter defluvii]|uniref:oligosaccharide flippase family protein n=1 Tax=Patulibacter defluvii TaxID=3095358 RepID=UPI002A755895|nr:oligosaccharide flippase family protein [Patulibacter sp. DM4]
MTAEVDDDAPSIGRDMRHGLVWSVLALVGSKLLGFVSILVLARLLAPDEFGTLAAVVTFLAFLQLGSDLGMQAAVVYEQERGISHRVHVAFTLNIALVVVLTAVGLVLAGPIASFLGSPDAAGLFRLGMLNLLLMGLGNVHDGLLLRDMAFSRRIRPQIAQSAVQAAVSIVLAVILRDATALVVGMLAGTAAWVAMQWRMTPFRPRLAFDRRIAREMIGYGGAAAVLEVTALVATRADAVVIGNVLGSTALGLYAMAFRLPELVLSNVTWTVSGVAFPALARQRARGLQDATVQLCRYLSLYTLPVAALLMVLADPIVGTLFSDRWQAAAPLLVAVAAMLAVQTLVFPLGDAAKALGHQRTMVAINLVHVPLLYGAMVLASDSGLRAVAWAGTGVSLLHTAFYLVWIRSLTGVGPGALAAALRAPVAIALAAAAGAAAVRFPLADAPDPLLLALGLAAALVAVVAVGRIVAPGLPAELLGGRDPRSLLPGRWRAAASPGEPG